MGVGVVSGIGGGGCGVATWLVKGFGFVDIDDEFNVAVVAAIVPVVPPVID